MKKGHQQKQLDPTKIGKDGYYKAIHSKRGTSASPDGDLRTYMSTEQHTTEQSRRHAEFDEAAAKANLKDDNDYVDVPKFLVKHEPGMAESKAESKPSFQAKVERSNQKAPPSSIAMKVIPEGLGAAGVPQGLMDGTVKEEPMGKQATMTVTMEQMNAMWEQMQYLKHQQEVLSQENAALRERDADLRTSTDWANARHQMEAEEAAARLQEQERLRKEEVEAAQGQQRLAEEAAERLKEQERLRQEQLEVAQARQQQLAIEVATARQLVTTAQQQARLGAPPFQGTAPMMTNTSRSTSSQHHAGGVSSSSTAPWLQPSQPGPPLQQPAERVAAAAIPVGNLLERSVSDPKYVGQDKSTAEDEMFGEKVITDEDAERILLSPGTSREAKEALQNGTTDVTATPDGKFSGNVGHTCGETAMMENLGDTISATLGKYLGGTVEAKGKIDTNWRSLERNVLVKIDSADVALSTNQRLISLQDDLVENLDHLLTTVYRIIEGWDQVSVEYMLTVLPLRNILVRSIELWLRFHGFVVQHIQRSDGRFTQQLRTILAHHCEQLNRIRLYKSSSRFMLIWKTYIYLRNAAAKKWTSAGLQSKLNEISQLAIMDMRSDLEVRLLDIPTTYQRCAKCRAGDEVIHAFGATCPFNDYTNNKARQMGVFARNLVRNDEKTVEEAIQQAKAKYGRVATT